MAALSIAVLVLGLLVGCSGSPARTSGPAVGTALQGDGLQLGAVVKLDDIEVGQTYRFGFPVLSNASTRPVTILGYHWESVPTGVRIGKVGVYSDRDAGALVIAYRNNRDEGLHLWSFRDHAGEVLRLRPHEPSDLFALIPFTVDRIGTGRFEGCVVRYRTNGHVYQQTFGCTYALEYRTGTGGRPTFSPSPYHPPRANSSQTQPSTRAQSCCDSPRTVRSLRP